MFAQQSNQNELVDVESTSDVPDFTVTHRTTTSDEGLLPIAEPNNDDDDDNDSNASSQMETIASLAQVKEKFRLGCECKTSCFKALKPEAVYRHRLNVTELTREEHDMYLMGVTMACLSNPTQTSRNKERQRQRATYVYQGKRVCIDAFTYLENVTTYHLRRIRQHILMQGVVPRVHGNMGKKPHNTFSLDMYKCAEHFIKQMLAAKQSQSTETSSGKPFILTGETRSSIYQKFKDYAQHPDGKVMGYTTFGHFVKKQFPNVRFVKDSGGGGGGSSSTISLATSVSAAAAATATARRRKGSVIKPALSGKRKLKGGGKSIFTVPEIDGQLKDELVENEDYFVVVDDPAKTANQ